MSFTSEIFSCVLIQLCDIIVLNCFFLLLWSTMLAIFILWIIYNVIFSMIYRFSVFYSHFSLFIFVLVDEKQTTQFHLIISSILCFSYKMKMSSLYRFVEFQYTLVFFVFYFGWFYRFFVSFLHPIDRNFSTLNNFDKNSFIGKRNRTRTFTFHTHYENTENTHCDLMIFQHIEWRFSYKKKTKRKWIGSGSKKKSK